MWPKVRGFNIPISFSTLNLQPRTCFLLRRSYGGLSTYS